ncbi:GIY-YIG nuclease family protein [Candidatus Uabimicrobium sp. HlEnr_7]|uniref:GIY-YIG nuclease family protein n=1 Tax=Candidatus Uabimicrobium helgolandensis TaxID=3095367 RepID=UPI003556380D
MKNIRKKLKEIPQTPGVYQFVNKDNNTIYIGKSVCLRSRVNSYLHKSKTIDTAYEKRRQLLRREMRDVHIHPTPTELLALLLEDKMIKDYLPRYNVRQKKFTSYSYLKFSENAFPRFEIVDEPAKDTIGPFKDKFIIEHLERFACEYFAFCRCTHTKRKCCYYDMKYCQAPHKSKKAAKLYPNSIAKTRKFLAGKDHDIVVFIEKKMHSYARSLKFEQAEKAKHDYLLSKYMIERHKFCSDFMFRHLIIWEENTYTYAFFQGDLLFFAPKYVAIRDITLPPNKTVQQHSFRFDRAAVIFEWIKRQSEIEYTFFTTGEVSHES